MPLRIRTVLDTLTLFVQPPQTGLIAPSNLAATAVSSSEIDLSWTDNSDNETGFLIERSSNGFTWASLTTVGAGVTTYHNTGLSGSALYYYRVSAFNLGGSSAPSNTATATLNGTLIDSAWLSANVTAHGGPPYVLDTANTHYVLGTDITVNGTAIIVLKDGITLDLNGHTITFGNLTALNLPANGGFESGTGTSVPNWDLSGAPTAAICNAADHWLFGSQALRFTTPSTAQVITSDSFSLPSSLIGHNVTATCTPSFPTGQSGAALLLEVVAGDRGSPGSVIVSHNNIHPIDQGAMCIATWQPASTGPFFIRLTYTPSASGSLDIDAVNVTASYDSAIITAHDGSGPPYSLSMPSGLASLCLSNVNVVRSFAVANSSPGTGGIVQGVQAGINSALFRGTFLATGLTCTNITCAFSGDQPMGFGMGGLIGGVSATVTITGNTITCPAVCNASQHFAVWSAMVFISNTTNSPITVAHNVFTGFPQFGIYLSQCRVGPILIDHNTLTGNAMVADAYAMQFSGTENFTVTNNTVVTPNGFALGLDDFASPTLPMQNFEVAYNTFDIVTLPDREVGNGGITYCIKHRNTSGGSVFGHIKNGTIHDNDMTVTLTSTSLKVGVTVFFSHADNDGGNLGFGTLMYNNNIKCIVEPSDSTFTGSALDIYNNTTGVNTGFWGNTLESNDTSLVIGGPNGNNITDLTVMSNTFKKSSSGDQSRTYHAIKIGPGTLANTYVFDPIFAGGATLTVANFSPNSSAKTLRVGYTETVNVQHSGSPVSGATVTLTNADTSDATAFAGINAATRTYPVASNAGITDGTGHWANVSVVTDVFSGTSSIAHATTTPTHHAAVSGSLAGSTDATPATSGTTTVAIT